jgi:predicted O-methyltransferase YrrM
MNGSPTHSPKSREEFEQIFLMNVATCEWKPHPLFSVFTQYDQEYYLERAQAFLCKYKCFYAVSKTIFPKKIIELGTCAGSSADAYLSAAPGAEYLGIDVFGVNTRHDDHSPWDPYEVAQRLFESRGFKDYQLLRADLRELSSLPNRADFVVVDASHDFDNAFADLKLALTAEPTFIFVDDCDDENGAKPALDQFLQQNLNGLVDYTVHISYIGGGLVIKLKDTAGRQESAVSSPEILCAASDAKAAQTRSAD